MGKRTREIEAAAAVAEEAELAEVKSAKKAKKVKKEVVEEEPEEPMTEKKKKKKKEKKEEEEEEEAPKGKGPSGEAGGEVCIRGLPFSLDEDAVTKLFAKCGEIESMRLLMQDGWSKGMAFCKFKTKDGSDKALELHESEVEGRWIKVEPSLNPTGAQSGGKGKGKGPGTKPEGCLSVMVMQLSDAVEEDDLWELFAECGTVARVKLLYDRDTQASRGMGFVDFEETEATDKAIKMTDKEYKGKSIFVKYNAPREEKGGKGKDGKGKGKGKGNSGPGEKPDGCVSVMVLQLSDAVEEDDLWELFAECGTIEKVKLLYDRDTQASRGMGFVDFEDTSSTDKAVKLTDKEYKGKSIYVKYNVPREPKGKGKGGW